MSLELKNVVKTYRQPDGSVTPVLDVAGFSLARGEQAVLVGDSGGGKTTLLNVIAGITTPDTGDVVIDNQNLFKLPEPARDQFRAERIGFIFQTFNLLPAFTALENVLLGMTFARGKSDRDKAKQLLVQMELGERLNHRPGQLSVGQQQRVAVARALANEPSLILADEPTANVDTANQDRVLELIRETCSARKVSLLMVTHSRDVASRFDRVQDLASFNNAGKSVT